MNKELEENIMSEEAFNEIVENLELIGTLTLYGRKMIKYHIKKLQEENRQYKRIKDIADSVTKEEIEEAIKRADREFVAKDKIREKLEGLEKQYKEALEKNSTKAFILKCQIEILEELLEGK